MTKKESDITSWDLPAKMAIFELQSYIEAIEKNAALFEEKNFEKRIEVTDFIGFQFMDQVEALLLKTDQSRNLILLKNRAENIKSELEEIDIGLFQILQSNIRKGGYSGNEFQNLVNEYFDFNAYYTNPLEEIGYDSLDIFINGIFPSYTIPVPTNELEPDMVYYQKTPARIVFELVEKSHFKKEDVFFDLGSGLGQVVILVNLLAGITTRGVEFEPAFCAYARACARELNLSNVTFINVDARNTDYSEGTVFFMFTPFKGELLQEVLEILRKESTLRKIKIITYGPCTARVSLQGWLDSKTPKDDNIYKLHFFSSL